MDQNKEIISKKSKKNNFLLDTSTILYFELMWRQSGVSIFNTLNELSEVNFFVCNDVLSELINGPKGIPPTALATFMGHVLNSESSMAPGWKENKFLIEINGEVGYVVLNKISSTDYAQILLCQNHPELILVVNDRKMLRSGSQVLQGRILGIPLFLDKLEEIYPNNKRIQILKETAEKMFVKKHAFRNISA